MCYIGKLVRGHACGGSKASLVGHSAPAVATLDSHKQYEISVLKEGRCKGKCEDGLLHREENESLCGPEEADNPWGAAFRA